MLNVKFSKIMPLSVAVLFLLASVSVQAVQKSTSTPNKTIQKDQKSVQRYKKMFGNQGVKGKDYSAQSTAGVGGANEQGLKSSASNKAKKVKKNMYKDQKSLNKAIKETINEKK